MKKILVCVPLVALAVSAAALAVGCGDDSTAASETDYTALLASLTENVAMPAFTDAAAKADVLVVALKALETTPTADTLTAAQNAWRTARASFRKLDTFTFGPMFSLGINARIDVAPADPAGIETSVTAADELTADYVGRLGGKRKGYLALEYLLFKGPDADVLSGFTASARRGTLARAIGDEIATSTHQLLTAWDPAQNGEGKQIETAGQAGSTYVSQRVALDNYVGGGAYALENVVGKRLALPLGHQASDKAVHPDLDPTLASDNANADNTATLAGVQALYDTPGFTTYVRPKVPALDDRAVAELRACAAAVAAIPRPFGTAVVSSNAVVEQAWTTCKAYKLTWNTDLTSTLGATLQPLDADGD